ncbi:hypothetical protein SAMN05216389_10557 [Oceanobacillus limi]|uniref:Uncharacterized protein n=1 Tax=Oceanobacillus limi TaxID=930131 RepID=A0A1I0BLK4_9BACI|nr:hypothetical protein [Oceanobacillus limi]SET07151.1 hypothetical protein SAMN05216389_10557 [Oceanobacillus limi]
MGKRKKNKSNTPRQKRMNRPRRLQAAEHWIPKYTGKSLVNGYSKHFAVNRLCAVIELEMLGYTFDDVYKQKLKHAEIQKQQLAKKRNAVKKQKREQAIKDFFYEESDETFAFIAGHTPGGAPYGITWEEWEEEHDVTSKSDSKPFRIDIDDDELPF